MRNGIELVKAYEGLQLKAYLCPANVWTIGYGNTFMENSFDNPFIITTFVQFFESIFSSSPSKLLKLKNYQKKIFLFDEIQSLDPSFIS